MRSQAKGAQSLEKNGQEKEIREFKQIKNWLMSLIKKKKDKKQKKGKFRGKKKTEVECPSQNRRWTLSKEMTLEFGHNF